MQLIALLKLAFASPTPIGLSLLHKLTRWPIIQKVRRQGLLPLRLLVSIRFQVLFHSPYRGSFHLSLTVLLFPIGQSGVLSLGEWSPHLQTEFLVFRPTLLHLPLFPYRTLTSFGLPSHAVPVILVSVAWLVRFRSPLLSESLLISFPLAT